MKQISLADAFDALSECDAVIWDESHLGYPSLFELSEHGNDEFLILNRDDEEGQTFTENFMQDGNEKVCVDGAYMWLTNTDGDKVKITLLRPKASAFCGYEDIGLHEEW